MESLKKFVENREKYENLVFFGGGNRLSSMISFFEICNLRMPVAICDNDVSKQGTETYDIPVMSFDDACDRFDNMHVVITNDRYMEGIFRQVTEKIPSKQVRYYLQGELFGYKIKNIVPLINRFMRNIDEYKNLVFFGAGDYLKKVMSFLNFVI